LGADLFNKQRVKARTEASVKEIIAFLELDSMPEFHPRLDKIRTFINDNSVHRIDQAFWANKANSDAFAAGLLAHAKGSAEPIHMECSTRTNVMGQILETLGYETRVIAIFDSHTNLKSHSFLEVLNPESGHWETQDADYDIYWRRKASSERISLADEAEFVEGIEPCGRNGCGWENRSREGMRPTNLKRYLDIISITADQKASRYTLYTSRTDLSRTYSKRGKQGAFCQVEGKRCKQGFYAIRKQSTSAPGVN
jgi:hypothetical protein